MLDQADGARRTFVKSRSRPMSVIGVLSSKWHTSWSRDRASDKSSNSVAWRRAGHDELARATKPFTTGSSLIRLMQRRGLGAGPKVPRVRAPSTYVFDHRLR